MKKIFLPVLLVSSLSVFAQNKINLNGLSIIEDYKQEALSRSAETSGPLIEVVVTVNPGWSDARFSEFDAELIETISRSIIIVKLPIDKIISFSQLSDVDYVEFGNEYHLTLDFARPGSNVDAIQEGFEYDNATVSFTGKGVVTGLMDQGIDPNHINFTDENGDLRVKAAYDFSKSLSATTPSAVKRFPTDDAQETHGTHVAGIMAGSYNGDGTYCYVSTPSGGQTKTITGKIPFYGVATESDIVMASGTFSDANILKGVKAVVDYAKSVGRPVAVNLSLGSNDGPHDGTGSLEEGLADLGKEGIICIAAGNEGDHNMFVGKKFTDSDASLKTFVVNNESSGIDIWTNNSDPVKVTVALYEPSRRRLTNIASVDGPGQSVSSNSVPVFSTYINGSFKLVSEVNSRNNRFHVVVSGTFEQKQAGQNVALIIEGKDGQEVYVYGFGNRSTSFASNGVRGYSDGTADGTISGVATSNNTVAVGSYTTRTSWGTFAGTFRYSGGGFSVGTVSPFSSFGTSFQGVDLPVICAPGANIQSSYSRYYTNVMSASDRSSTTSASVDGNMTNYWGPMQGTSMACPYVSGTVALWLEADPTLTCSDVIDILKKTAVAPSTTDELKLKQWGGGKLDALAGIKEVLRRKAESGGIDGVIADADGYVISPVGDRAYSVMVDGAGQVTATLYNMQGIAVATAQAQGNEAVITADGVQPGVYILAVDAPNTARISRRLLLK